MTTRSRLHRAGALAMIAFAFVWALTGATGFGGDAARIVVAVAAVLTGASVWAVLRVDRAPAMAPPRLPVDWQRRSNRIGAAQGVAIVGAVILLGRLGAPGYIPSAVCTIVAAHFLPLARLFDLPRFRWTAAGLLAVGALGAGVAPMAGAAPARALVGVGAAGVLWLTAVTRQVTSVAG